MSDTIEKEQIDDILKKTVKEITSIVNNWVKKGLLDESKLNYMLKREVNGNHSRNNRETVKKLVDKLLNPKKKMVHVKMKKLNIL